MRVGIVSMQRIKNYGSFLQAYSLKNTIESLGHSVTFIDFIPGPIVVPAIEQPNIQKRRLIKNRYIRGVLRLIRTCLLSPGRASVYSTRVSDFYNNFDEYLKQLGLSVVSNHNTIVDTVIVGSDEVFNCTQDSESIGFSRQLFGQDLNTKKVISYAASFGGTTSNILHNLGIAEKVTCYLKTFAAISVRDANSFDIVQELTGITPEMHVDPVLIYNYDIPISVPINDYILVYAYPGRIKSAEEIHHIKIFAKEKHLKLITIGMPQMWCDDHINANPFELLAYIKNAKYVITDTFHGAVFSIKYNRPFSVFIRSDRGIGNYSNAQKIWGLLSIFNLTDRVVDQPCQLRNIMDRVIDINSINLTIKNEASRSLSYLRENIEL